MYTTLQDTHAFIINKFGIYIYIYYCMNIKLLDIYNVTMIN
jgi:hypothetical protein